MQIDTVSCTDTDDGRPSAVDDDEKAMSAESFALRPFGRQMSKKDVDLHNKYQEHLDGLDKI